MKIDINQIQPEGLLLEEAIVPSELDIETDTVKFSGPIMVKAEVSRITNAVTVHADIRVPMHMRCSRCLEDFSVDYRKKLQLNYQVSSTDLTVNLTPDIRQEIFLDYPIKPLCSSGCRGLCPQCGKNLNQGECGCNVKR